MYVTEKGDVDDAVAAGAGETRLLVLFSALLLPLLSMLLLLLLAVCRTPPRPGSSGVAVSINISRAERTTRRLELPPRCIAAAPCVLARLGVVKADIIVEI